MAEMATEYQHLIAGIERLDLELWQVGEEMAELTDAAKGESQRWSEAYGYDYMPPPIKPQY
jgi:hypothetical protein